MDNGETRTYSYTGSVQTFTVPNKGIYKLEVWGAAGDAAGGYSVGYKQLTKGTVLYIVVGGAGETKSPYTTGGAYTNSGGYNGGGYGQNAGNSDNTTTYRYGGGGGGATHIALVTGTLSSIGKTSFVDEGNGLIVAGGGGGSAADMYRGTSYGGGSGGGTSGNSGGSGGAGGTQSSGYAFGQGGNAPRTYRGGGGGGFYGGYAGTDDAPKVAGGGGSGWIGGVPEFTDAGITYSPSTTNGQRSGNGQAVITLVKKSSVVKLGTLDCDVYLGSNQVDSVYIGSIEI